MANKCHDLDAVGSLESPWALGSWKSGRSSPKAGDALAPSGRGCSQRKDFGLGG